jgi:extracellular factor (EF) 3-hydroxypalmitic acid methyl ester biosynthesis protein
MRQEIEYLKILAEKGGPVESQYEELGKFYKSVNSRRKKGLLSESEVMAIWEALPDVYITKDTMQGYALLKPHGYSGDYVIIERIYQRWLSPKEHLVNWDRFFHAQEAPRAIINRKKYFLDILRALEEIDGKRDVLNIGCGPCQDIADFLSEGESQIFFECVDYDKNAIEYSHNKFKEKGFLKKIEFHRDNALRFRPPRQYDLIWSAGLFDYLDEKIFKMLLSRLLNFVKPGGEIVIGNFSLDNPTRDYMECGNWFLYHRSPDDLFKIACECGIPHDKIYVKSESLGVNLFLHISR